MKNKVTYEWDVETIDEYGDVQDHFHGSTIKQATMGRWPLEKNEQLVLIRNVGNAEDGTIKRSWAYLSTDKYFPAEFDSGHKVPNRYLKEFFSYTHRRNKTMRKHHKYLGKAVYASFDGHNVWLHLHSKENAPLIALEPTVLLSLFHYAQKLKERTR